MSGTDPRDDVPPHRPPRGYGREGDGAPIEPLAAVGPGGVEEAVEQLLEEVGVDPVPQPRPQRIFEDLRGRTAIVTGASTGIGKAIALEFGRAGVNVAFNYLGGAYPEADDDALAVANALREMEVLVHCRPCDVRDPDQVRVFVREAHARLGGLHILVNNAGIGRDRALWKMTDDQWRAVIDTNLSGAFYFIREVAPYFRRQEYGKVVNMTSVHGLRSEFGISNYAASKAGVMALTRSAAVELGNANVNVNAVAPGYIRTTRLTDGVPPEILDRARERSVLGRLGDPQDVAGAVLFLCSEAARHITGAVIPIDGGYLL